ncbi:MAG: nickel pincer cofactor biosynthesis protein LarB [Bryocella sp.]
MRRDALVELLRSVEAGSVTPEDAAKQLAVLPFEDLGFAKIDHHRALRTGMPEVVFGAGKTPAQTAAILQKVVEGGEVALATRADDAMFAAVKAVLPNAVYHAMARCIVVGLPEKTSGRVAVLCAGTSDLPVAEEAAVTAETFGADVIRMYDVGVAGLHRLLAQLESLRTADVVVVCAGMEGALASVVGGLVDAPVIAVPTSVGYGASFGGMTALMGMMNSCSSNVVVVNIDNGFGAGANAARIAGMGKK